jgi:hypothetical protein
VRISAEPKAILPSSTVDEIRTWTDLSSSVGRSPKLAYAAGIAETKRDREKPLTSTAHPAMRGRRSEIAVAIIESALQG